MNIWDEKEEWGFNKWDFFLRFLLLTCRDMALWLNFVTFPYIDSGSTEYEYKPDYVLVHRLH